MSRPPDQPCVDFMVEHTPPGAAPDFVKLAPRWRKARSIRNAPSLVEASLRLTWHRWKRKLRMGK